MSRTDKHLRDFISEGTKMLFFGAKWCSSCPAQEIIMQSIQDIPWLKLDPTHHAELASECGVKSLPSVAILHNGKVFSVFRGTTKASILRDSCAAAEV